MGVPTELRSALAATRPYLLAHHEPHNRCYTLTTDLHLCARCTGILAILLGGIGVHKFYQGNTKLGILYLCFSWTFIPANLGLIEGILILVADEDEYDRKYADGSILGT